MAIAIFTFCPRLSASADAKFSIRTAQFGDGYIQTSANGLNPRSQEWSLEFTGNEAFIKAIKNFLDAHQGYQAFQWQPPLEAIGLYRCDDYKPTALGAGMYNLAATFKTAYGLSTDSAAKIAPYITAQPESLTVMNGGGATFNVVAAGTQPFTYKWERSTNGTTWTQVATTQTFTITQTALTDTAQIRVTVTNAYGSVVSTVVNLTVQEQPVVPSITVQPVATTEALTGANIVLSVTASGSGTLVYQWQKQSGSAWNNVDGGTGASLVMSSVETSAAGLYRVVVSNDVGQVISSTSSVLVNEYIIPLTGSSLPTGVTVITPAHYVRNSSNTLDLTTQDAWPLEYDGALAVGRSGAQPEAVNILPAPFNLDNTNFFTRARLTLASGQPGPDGSSTAVTIYPTVDNNNHVLSSTSIPVTANTGDKYTYSFFAKNAGYNRVRCRAGYNGGIVGDLVVDLTTGQITAGTTTAVVKSYGNGWWRVSVTISALAATTSLNIAAWIYDDTGAATFVGDPTKGISLWLPQIVAGDYPLRRVLPATQGANLLTSPKDFSNAAWAVTRAVKTAGQTAPDGTTAAAKVVADTSNNSHYLRQVVPVNSLALETQTVWVKAAGYNFASIQFGPSATISAGNAIYLDLVNGTFTATDNARARMQNMGNGWFKVSLQITTSATPDGFGIFYFPATAQNSGGTTFTGNGTDGILVWNPELYEGHIPAGDTITVAKNYNATRLEVTYNTGDKTLLSFGSASSLNLPVETANWQDRFITQLRYMA